MAEAERQRQVEKAAARAIALGVAAGATLLLDRPAVLALADQHSLALVAFP